MRHHLLLLGSLLLKFHGKCKLHHFSLPPRSIPPDMIERPAEFARAWPVKECLSKLDHKKNQKLVQMLQIISSSAAVHWISAARGGRQAPIYGPTVISLTGPFFFLLKN